MSRKIVFSVAVSLSAIVSFALEFSANTESNLVFASGDTVEVASGLNVWGLGTFNLGGSANGTITKTGGGTFTVGTAVINGKANGDSADGAKASLAVTGGTFRVSTPAAVNSTFSGIVTVGEYGAFAVDSGTISTPQLTMEGGTLRMTGGTFTWKARA